ncbi:Macrophage mannose receptor 1 [Exaiptasia diaphana]|nr:Macrophage mannose receptor 1 [Exaiptasia diaphana]
MEWKIFNSSQFRLFEDRVTWGEARHKCRAHKGDLVSIHSQQEQDFISTHLLNNASRGNSTNTQLIMLWKLNGISDVALSLHGDAVIKDIDGYKALYLDGNSQNYATTKQMSLIQRGFTIGAWVKLLTPASEGLVYGDWSAPYQFALKIDKEGKVHFKLMFITTNTTTLTANR